ncbi:squalene cyclase [Microbacterium sp. G2-8]|uniref:squalene cyclase n=1 Tax=Microbacterium sp. G2-8 TaxID=2842454 RepID=UPI0021AA6DA0|nr:squalene cyclase [Microbacterium sp. G2-8]
MHFHALTGARILSPMTHPPVVGQDVIEWLLDTDPALRWQVERDLLGAPDDTWKSTRAGVIAEGFGARLLAEQDDDGMWGGAAYYPRAGHRAARAPGDDAQAWTATTWSLTSLREWGVPAVTLGDTAQRLERNARWEHEGLPYWGGETCVCINALTVSNGLWLGRDMTDLAHWFVEHSMDEGGWNCDWTEGSVRASVDATLNGLLGILDYERHTGGSDALRSARAAGEEYLLRRRLLWRVSDGGKILDRADQFTYPGRWFYSILRALDYFRRVHEHQGGEVDPRLDDAVEILRGKQRSDGTWAVDWVHPGKVWFAVDGEAGTPSPWLTFEALRVLKWWDSVR